MKVSKHQFRDDIFNFVTFDDYHEAIEDALSIYKVDESKCYSYLKDLETACSI